MRTILSLFSIGMISLCQISAQDIVSPQKRAVSLDLAKSLLTTQPLGMTDDELERKNPFNPVAVASAQSAVVAAESAAPVVADRDRLSQLASQLIPTGSVQLGGTAYLLFGQKKFKVGDSLPISFQGSIYELVITAIERTSFSLRLNNEEITRPIKPVASN